MQDQIIRRIGALDLHSGSLVFLLGASIGQSHGHMISRAARGDLYLHIKLDEVLVVTICIRCTMTVHGWVEMLSSLRVAAC
jgi:hypothetical protein